MLYNVDPIPWVVMLNLFIIVEKGHFYSWNVKVLTWKFKIEYLLLSWNGVHQLHELLRHCLASNGLLLKSVDTWISQSPQRNGVTVNRVHLVSTMWSKWGAIQGMDKPSASLCALMATYFERSGWTLYPIMTCLLTTQSHCLIQWLRPAYNIQGTYTNGLVNNHIQLLRILVLYDCGFLLGDHQKNTLSICCYHV